MNYADSALFRDVRVPELEGPEIVAEPQITDEGVVYELAGRQYDVPRQLAGDTPRETRKNVREYIMEQGHPRLSPGGSGAKSDENGENDISTILSGQDSVLDGI